MCNFCIDIRNVRQNSFSDAVFHNGFSGVSEIGFFWGQWYLALLTLPYKAKHPSYNWLREPSRINSEH